MGNLVLAAMTIGRIPNGPAGLCCAHAKHFLLCRRRATLNRGTNGPRGLEGEVKPMVVPSAGILLYRLTDAGEPQVWIAHMGGPFWARKQAAAWSIPKGEYEPGEDPFVAARREFEEEIGVPAPDARYVSLGDFRQPSGKIVTVFAAEADFILDRLVSNTFELEWPKGSGVLREFPEVDDARWVGLAEARVKLVRGQLAVLNVLEERLRAEGRLFE
jgi:predicted NUDIX family NTP pyrophosphohydrolase